MHIILRQTYYYEILIIASHALNRQLRDCLFRVNSFESLKCQETYISNLTVFIQLFCLITLFKPRTVISTSVISYYNKILSLF